MSNEINVSQDGVEQLSIGRFAEQAYLNYSMYVIMDRALPHIGDGLKPVQRRIIYAMSELGLSAKAKYKKSARTVGDVLGKYHPHGDSACYEAMVLMAQPFSYRYPLVDGQGNWGAPDDPKSFAAMRYTESRLAKFSEVLLSELGQGTVDWGANFDGTMKEPLTLPAQLPHILLNGITGIAVGMATDIPPHNVKEVGAACQLLLKKPDATLEEVMEHIPAPDYPTKAEIITPKADIAKIYQHGKGSIKMRATYELEQGEVVITALPHQVSGGKILEQIAAQMQAKKLPMVTDLRDESDHENPVRLVISPRSNRVDIEPLMQHLFATTELEKSYRVNLNMIGLNGKPQVKGITTILNEWLEYRRQVTTRRLEYRLDKVLSRLHILEGLLVAFLNIDEVIEIIRTYDKPKAELCARFNLSEKQAESILELKLRQLAKLEEIKIRGEQEELAKERDQLESILGSAIKMKNLIARELKAACETYGDDRRSPIVERSDAKQLSETDLLPSEAITAVISNKGWIRAAKGHDIDVHNLNYKAGDGYLTSAKGRTNQFIVMIDSTGRSFTAEGHTLPSARGQGEPITGRFNIAAGAQIEQMLMDVDGGQYLMASDAGYGFVCSYKDMITRNKSGKALLSLPKNAKVLAPQKIASDNSAILAISNEGRMLLFGLDALPKLSKGKGNKIISISSAKAASREEWLSKIAIVPEGASVTLWAGKRKLTLKPQDLAHYQSERGRRGAKLPRGLQRVDDIVVESATIEPATQEGSS